MTYSRRRAAAIEAVTEIELTTASAPRPDASSQRPTPPYVPIGYGPEKAIAVVLLVLFLIGGIFAVREYRHWSNVPAEIEHTVEEMTK